MKCMKRWLCAVMLLVSCLLFFTGCGDQGIEGEWILVKEVTGDGETLSKKDLEEEGISETYTITGDNVHYTLETDQLDKPVDIDFALEDLGDGHYKFKSGDIDFVTVTLKGGKMIYTVGEGENSSTMTFERK